MLSRALLGAAALVIIGQTAEAQSLASRVAAVRDGKVRMTFASRDDICGFANGISTRGDNHSTWSKERSADVEYDVDCSEGPARVVLQMRDGRPVEVKGYVGGRWRNAPGVTDLGTVGVREATTFLLEVAGRSTSKVSSSAIFATTLADSVDMGPTLFAFARNESHPHEAREHAIFWMSQVSGDRVVGYLERILNESRDGQIQDKAIFGLSQHDSDRARAILRDYAVGDRGSEKLRGQAIFWLGQGRRGESTAYLASLYTQLKSSALKDKVIFSLSQKRDPAAFDKLMDIAKNDPDRDMRKKAMFWLGQSKDPRVAQMLSDIINR